MRLQPGHFVRRSLTAHRLDFTTEIHRAHLKEFIEVDDTGLCSTKPKVAPLSESSRD